MVINKAKTLAKLLALMMLLGSAIFAQLPNAQPTIPSLPKEAFSPSNTRTQTGELIEVEQFFSAERCSYCHQDVYNAWSESLHRNAAREPFYRESADILLNTRGIEFTRHCESCHTPVALLSGTLTKGVGSDKAPFTPLDHEGVTCVICHSITEARLDGTASYTIRRPALLVKEDGIPIYGDVSDEEIMANIDSHKRAMMRPLLRTPEFCATCHKVSSTPSLNGYKQLLGFTAYDEWQQSGASKETIQSFYPRPQRATCQSCHMPKVSADLDLAAKEGKIALHRWPGANTAAPLFYGQDQQVKITENFLKDDVLNIDIIALKTDNIANNSNSLITLTPNKNNLLSLEQGQEVTAEVVVANRGAAHSFPPEVRDLYEAWVEFIVTDNKGQTVFHSGFVKADGMLDETAHVYKTILLDKNSRTITRHQIWQINIKAYDNAIQAGKSDVVHYRFRVPEGGKFNLQAKVHYRRLTQEYTNYVLKQQNRSLTIPIVEMANTKTSISLSSQTSLKNQVKDNKTQFNQLNTKSTNQLNTKFNSKLATESTNQLNTESTNKLANKSNLIEARRWNDYGIALLEQGQYGQAAKAFTIASELDPNDASLLVNIAIAEMRTERFGQAKEQFLKAKPLIEQALEIEHNQPRAKFYQSLVLRGLGEYNQAAIILKELAKLYPRDREVHRQLANTLYSLGDLSNSQVALEEILKIDPTDAASYQLLSTIYQHQGQIEKSQKAQQLYLEWRQDPMADSKAAKFFASHREWTEERINYHEHSSSTSPRPVLVGQQANPVNKPE